MARDDRRHGDSHHGYLLHGDLLSRGRDGVNRRVRYHSARRGAHLWTCSGRGWTDPQRSVQLVVGLVIGELHGDSLHRRDGDGCRLHLPLCVDQVDFVGIPPFSLRTTVRPVCCDVRGHHGDGDDDRDDDNGRYHGDHRRSHSDDDDAGDDY